MLSFGERKLGFGLMRLPTLTADNPADLDLTQIKAMVDLFLERGFTYFDTAWMYCGFASEDAARICLVERHPRESFTLADKLHSAFVRKEADRDKVFTEQLRKTGAGYFDFYLLHGIEPGSIDKYEEFKCFDWILEKKAAGLIRHAGFSFHGDAALLDRILTAHPEMEFVQLQINYLDWEDEFIQSRLCYETAVRHGKPVVVMEGIKGGTLASVPAEAEALLKAAEPDKSVPSWALRFAATLPGVAVVLSGMSDLAQTEENTGIMQDFAPLTEADTKLLERVADVIRGDITIPCTACSYCTDGCPMHIAIPQYFKLYNGDMRESKEKGWTPAGQYYRELGQNFGKASECIACGQCEGVCPQHLPIIEHLKSVAAHFEG